MDDIMRAVKNMYDESGEYFSKTREKKYGSKSSNWPITQKYLDELKIGQSVLDVGCGSGRLLSGLPNGVEYLGIDFSETLLKIARESYPEREFVLGDIADKNVWEGLSQYDAVFCVASLHHLPSRKLQLMVLREMKKVLKPGGFLFLSVWNLWSERMEKKLGGIYLVVGEMVEIPFDGKSGRHVMAMDEEYLTGLMSEAEWEVEVVENGSNWVMVARYAK